jgi:hypothetical protein
MNILNLHQYSFLYCISNTELISAELKDKTQHYVYPFTHLSLLLGCLHAPTIHMHCGKLQPPRT